MDDLQGLKELWDKAMENLAAKEDTEVTEPGLEQTVESITEPSINGVEATEQLS